MNILIKTILLIIMLFSNIVVCHSQNIINNGGFEIADSCPYNMSQLDFCRGWKTAHLTPDYFNCGFDGNIVQSFPHLGTGYIGLLGGTLTALTTVPYTEMVKTKLIAPLIPGKKYVVKFSLGLGLFSAPDNYIDFGLYFYNGSNPLLFRINSDSCISEQPQIKLSANNLLQNTYSDFSFCFTPSQTYDSLLIGSFCNNNTLSSAGLLEYFMFDDLEIKEFDSFDFIASPTLICGNGYTNFIRTDSTLSGNSYWQFEQGNPSSSSSNIPPPVFYSQTGKYSVTLIVNDVCTDTIVKPDYINVKGRTNEILSEDTITKCDEESTVLKTMDGSLALWSTGVFANNIIVKDPGFYYCTVMNECDTITDSVFVKNNICPCGFFIPNSFTPDDDGLNDCFKIYGDGSDLELTIYNRWGELIYSTTDKDFCWNGTFNGNIVSQGVYAYKAKFKNCKSVIENVYGTVTVLY